MIENMSPKYGDYVDSEYDHEADFTIVMMVLVALLMILIMKGMTMVMVWALL